MLTLFKRKITNVTPSLVSAGLIIIVIIVIGLINYKPGTILTGWDNLHPEFNLLLNIKRSFFAVWQEYQSLGLVGGMGHAADLLRQLVLLLLSSFVPQQLLRYVWTILTLAMGGMGMVFLSNSIIAHSSFGLKVRNIRLLPFIISLFYILNLATVQTYYVPFETFTAHFAFLPWMLLASLHFFNNQSRKNAIILALTLFLTTPQSYVPTLFVVFIIAATLILLSSAYRLVRLGRTIKLLKIAIKYYSIAIISNAFWLFPFLYFTVTNASTNVNSKINQLSTPRIVLQNKEFGTVPDVALLKGFWFNSIDPNFSKVSSYMLEPWRTHMANPLVTVLGFVLFGIIILGLIEAFRRREPLLVSFGVLFLFVFTMICNTTLPFSLIDEIFVRLPLFSQAFRFPFTKFSILAGLLYALFFGIGIERIIELLIRATKKAFRLHLGIPYAVLTIAIIGLLVFSLPIFQGKLFYEKEQLKLPSDYQRVFEFFDKKPLDARIATLPMSSFWSWNYYEWGYGGSGFLWYGIKQPIIDRAFDSWGATSENSYNELSYALYSKNAQQLENVLNKYQISYLILDKNIYSATSQKSLFYSETKDIMKTIKATKEATFGNIDIYHVPQRQKTQNFVYSRPMPQSINGYKWGDNDVAYKTFGDYVTDNNPNTYFPFRSLYTNKKLTPDFKVEQNEQEITLVAKLPKVTDSQLILPAYSKEKLLPVEITVEVDASNNVALISAKPLFPSAWIANRNLTPTEPVTLPLFVVPLEDIPYTLFINGEKMVSVNVFQPQKMRVFLKLTQDNMFSLSHPDIDQLYIQTIQKDILLSLPQMQEKTFKLKGIGEGKALKIRIPKAIDSLYSYRYDGKNFNNASDCNEFRNGITNTKVTTHVITYEAKNDSVCSSVYGQGLLHNEGYIVSVDAANIKGSPIHFWALNDFEGIAPLDLNLYKNGVSTFFVPPMEENASAYSFHADTLSIGNETSKNILRTVEVSRVPYNYITSIILSKPFTIAASASGFLSTHPNESLYRLQPVKIEKGRSLVVLSQSYDPGWQAYEGEQTFWASIFPFLTGRALPHVKVNNWENGWVVDSSTLSKNSQITIIYLPQYLEYLGFLGVLALLSILIFRPVGTLLVRRLRLINAFFEKHAQSFKKRIVLRLYKTQIAS